MSKWYICYSIDGIKKWNIYEAKHTLEAKEMCLNENKNNNIQFIEVDICYDSDLEEADEILAKKYKSIVTSLI